MSGDGDLFSLRGRAGYDMGRFMPYLTAGVAKIDAYDVSETGWLYGVGADFKVTERFVLGGEYTHHEFSDVLEASNTDLDTDLFQIRASFRF